MKADLAARSDAGPLHGVLVTTSSRMEGASVAGAGPLAPLPRDSTHPSAAPGSLERPVRATDAGCPSRKACTTPAPPARKSAISTFSDLSHDCRIVSLERHLAFEIGNVIPGASMKTQRLSGVTGVGSDLRASGNLGFGDRVQQVSDGTAAWLLEEV